MYHSSEMYPMTCRAARDDQFDIYNTHVISCDMWYRFSETYRLWCDTAEKCNEKSGLAWDNFLYRFVKDCLRSIKETTVCCIQFITSTDIVDIKS